MVPSIRLLVIAALLVGAGALALPTSTSQTVSASPIQRLSSTSVQISTNPHPRDIFVLTDRDFPSGFLTNFGSTTYPPGATVTLFQVPLDKWLVVNDIRIVTNTWGAGAYWELQEVSGGSVKPKRTIIDGRFSTPISYPLGIVFSPGSTAALHNSPVQQWYLTLGQFALLGYLVPD